MLTLKTSAAVAILAGAMAATAGATYVATKASVNVSIACPSASAEPAQSGVKKPDLPEGAPLPMNQGKKF